MTTSIMWFRTDLRVADNPALLAAVKAADETLALICYDPAFAKEGDPRFHFMHGAFAALNDELDGNLVVRHGDPRKELSKIAKEVGATQIFISEDFYPYGYQRDKEVEEELSKHDITLERVDSGFAVEPGTIRKDNDEPYYVFTPFSKAWRKHGWGKPHPRPRAPKWAKAKSDGIPAQPKVDADMPKAGEKEAMKRLNRFLETSVQSYAENRNFPAIAGTSRLSPYLKFGCIHPRQILDKLPKGKGGDTFATELCWRDFYADVLFHHPETMDQAMNEKMRTMKVDEGKLADERFEAWCEGRTGYPIVDAGMRQLKGEAWVHNRVRMIVASFLIKDLHIDWTRGAKHFMDYLVDGDFASNTHGWQWVAGTGTDAAPYFRIFNPVTQGQKFDPKGEYIRKWVPELAELSDKEIHEPWTAKQGAPDNYPGPIVDHKAEREESLRRYAALKG